MKKLTQEELIEKTRLKVLENYSKDILSNKLDNNVIHCKNNVTRQSIQELKNKFTSVSNFDENAKIAKKNVKRFLPRIILKKKINIIHYSKDEVDAVALLIEKKRIKKLTYMVNSRDKSYQYKVNRLSFDTAFFKQIIKDKNFKLSLKN